MFPDKSDFILVLLQGDNAAYSRSMKCSGTRRATAGLAKANSREHNKGHGRLSINPMGTSTMHQHVIAALDKDPGHGLVLALGALRRSVYDIITLEVVLVKP